MLYLGQSSAIISLLGDLPSGSEFLKLALHITTKPLYLVASICSDLGWSGAKVCLSFLYTHIDDDPAHRHWSSRCFSDSS